MSMMRIDLEYLADVLERLLKTPSPTGYTDGAVRLICAELENMGADFELTRRGAIRATLKGENSHGARAIVSHVDTLGAQVKYLKHNGRLELVPVGHWSARFAEGARTKIFSEKGVYTGTILPLKASGHTFNEEIDTQPVGWEHVELRVDAWSSGPDDLHRLGIEIGDMVAVEAQPESWTTASSSRATWTTRRASPSCWRRSGRCSRRARGRRSTCSGCSRSRRRSGMARPLS